MDREGATRTPGDEARHAAGQAAQRVWQVVASGYGPAGAWKLVGDELTRGSQAVRQLPGRHTAPYRGLVEEVARHGGQSALAAMVAARVVSRTLDAPGRLPQHLQGVIMARRQVLAWLAAQARPARPADALGSLAGGVAPALLAGIERLGPEPDLDAVDVRPGPGEDAAWSPGLVLEPREAPTGQVVKGKVLVVGDLLPKPRNSPSLRTGNAQAITALVDAEAARLRDLQASLHAAGVAIVVARKGDSEVAAALARQGILTVTDAASGLARRVALATGARAVHSVAEMDGALGHGRAVRRPHRRGGWTLTGDGPAGTLEVPGQGPWGEMRVTEAEGWLRAVAPILADSRVLDGGGRWQADAAAALRKAADHAPGAAPLGIRAVAAALDDIRVALLTNLGLDPTRARAVEAVVDAYACVRPALAAGLDAAIQILRIDGVFAKRPSSQGDLRGPGKRVGSPRGMPGDIPPLM